MGDNVLHAVVAWIAFLLLVAAAWAALLCGVPVAARGGMVGLPFFNLGVLI